MSEFSDWERRGDGPYHTDPKLQREAAFNAGRTIGRAEGMEIAYKLAYDQFFKTGEGKTPEARMALDIYKAIRKEMER